ncbi:MAG: uracil-DNA glycosylase family protein [Bacteroidales bacterium]|nr:uracil-DNA glycosylase family protein [Bacteroidales bacterium]
MQTNSQPIERHPLEPFLPKNAKILFLGSFPPQKIRWSIDFFYPNFQNDMWRIWGLNFFNNQNHFIVEGSKKFDYDKIIDFCNTFGFAFYDTASAVRRLQDNASDKFLEIIEETDLSKLLPQIPHCNAIVTTGEKATDVLVKKYACEKPKVGDSTTITIDSKEYAFYRMPSSSRAYPLALTKKAEAYSILKKFFIE